MLTALQYKAFKLDFLISFECKPQIVEKKRFIKVSQKYRWSVAA